MFNGLVHCVFIDLAGVVINIERESWWEMVELECCDDGFHSLDCYKALDPCFLILI